MFFFFFQNKNIRGAMMEESLFHMLPVELGIMVLEYLTPRDVCTSFAPTCRQAYALSNNPLLWSSFYHRILVHTPHTFDFTFFNSIH